MLIWKRKSLWHRNALCFNQAGALVCRYIVGGKWYKPVYTIENMQNDQWQIRAEGIGITQRLYLWDVPIGSYTTKLTSGDPIEIGTHRYLWKWTMKGFFRSEYQILDEREEIAHLKFNPKMRWNGRIEIEVHYTDEIANSTEFGLLLGLGWHLIQQEYASAAA